MPLILRHGLANIGLVYLAFALAGLLWLVVWARFTRADEATRVQNLRRGGGSIASFALIGTAMLIGDLSGFVLWYSHRPGNSPILLGTVTAAVCMLPMVLSALPDLRKRRG